MNLSREASGITEALRHAEQMMDEQLARLRVRSNLDQFVDIMPGSTHSKSTNGLARDSLRKSLEHLSKQASDFTADLGVGKDGRSELQQNWDAHMSADASSIPHEFQTPGLREEWKIREASVLSGPTPASAAHLQDLHHPVSPAKTAGNVHETPTQRARSPFSPSTVHKIPDPAASQAYHLESPQASGAAGTPFRPDASASGGPNSWNLKVLNDRIGELSNVIEKASHNEGVRAVPGGASAPSLPMHERLRGFSLSPTRFRDQEEGGARYMELQRELREERLQHQQTRVALQAALHSQVDKITEMECLRAEHDTALRRLREAELRILEREAETSSLQQRMGEMESLMELSEHKVKQWGKRQDEWVVEQAKLRHVIRGLMQDLDDLEMEGEASAQRRGEARAFKSKVSAIKRKQHRREMGLGEPEAEIEDRDETQASEFDFRLSRVRDRHDRMWSILEPEWKSKMRTPGAATPKQRDPSRAWTDPRRYDQLSRTLGLFSPMDAGGPGASSAVGASVRKEGYTSRMAASPWSSTW